MDRIGAALAGDTDDFLDAQVGGDRAEPLADAIGFVGLETVQGKLVLLGIDCDRTLAQLVGGAHHADGDFSAVGDEDFLELWHTSLPGSCRAFTHFLHCSKRAM